MLLFYIASVSCNWMMTQNIEDIFEFGTYYSIVIYLMAAFCILSVSPCD